MEFTIILNNPLVRLNTPECKGNLENKNEERFALTDTKIYYKAIAMWTVWYCANNQWYIIEKK